MFALYCFNYQNVFGINKNAFFIDNRLHQQGNFFFQMVIDQTSLHKIVRLYISSDCIKVG